MNSADLEKVYESVALKLDEVGQENRELYLAKLVLLLAHSHGDVEAVQKHIEDASAGVLSS